MVQSVRKSLSGSICTDYENIHVNLVGEFANSQVKIHAQQNF